MSLNLSVCPFKLGNIVRACTLQILLVMVTAIEGEIRCYCNQPICVSTGYMCKSSSGVCYTEHLTHSRDLSRSRHGCLELLQEKKKPQCHSSISETTSTMQRLQLLPVVLCCKEDMCNYMNTMDINIQIQTKSNHSYMPGPYSVEHRRFAYEAALQQDLWFKAAVIAVPIAGGFILILLILLAARMLRQDNKRQRQVLEHRRRYHHHHHKTHVHHLLFPNPQCSHLPQHHIAKHGYKNDNLSLSNDSCCLDVANEKNFVYDRSLDPSATLLPWSKWDPVKSSTLV